MSGTANVKSKWVWTSQAEFHERNLFDIHVYLKYHNFCLEFPGAFWYPPKNPTIYITNKTNCKITFIIHGLVFSAFLLIGL